MEAHAPEGLTVIYDPECGFCWSVRHMLEAEPGFIPMTFLPYGGKLANERYPGLCSGPKAELMVIDAQGGVYVDTKAYLMCMYATRSYRALSLRLATPMLAPLTRQAFAFLGRNRHSLSRLLGMRSERELARELGQDRTPRCAP